MIKKYIATQSGYHKEGDIIETDDKLQQCFFDANKFWYKEVSDAKIEAKNQKEKKVYLRILRAQLCGEEIDHDCTASPEDGCQTCVEIAYNHAYDTAEAEVTGN